MDSESVHSSLSLDDGPPRPQESAASLSVEPLRRKESCRTWRHPLRRSIEVPYSTAVAMALIQMGVRDYAAIAVAACLSVKEVQRIDMAEDRLVRQLGVAGIPQGVYFKLHETVRCPKCNALVKMAPCIACTSVADASQVESAKPTGNVDASQSSHGGTR